MSSPPYPDKMKVPGGRFPSYFFRSEQSTEEGLIDVSKSLFPSSCERVSIVGDARARFARGVTVRRRARANSRLIEGMRLPLPTF
eukprot:1179415-Amorphochlora_amoeboformis.AAC.1